MSSINPNNIDGTYPIAGQDNDSQGFRDNFTNIKNNLSYAYDELTDLQSKVVLKSALNGGSLSNDMAYNQLSSAQLLKAVETRNDLGTKTGSFTISWADAHFQLFTTSGNCTITGFTNWPTSGYYTKLRIQVTTDAANRTLTFPTAVSVGLSTIRGVTAGTQTITFSTAGVYVFELTTYDAGATITIEDIITIGAPIYQYYAPVGNVAVIANLNVSRLIFNHTVTSLGANVTLPNTVVDGTYISISSTATIAQLAVTAPWNSSLVPFGNITLAAGTIAEYFYHAVENKWLKIG